VAYTALCLLVKEKFSACIIKMTVHIIMAICMMTEAFLQVPICLQDVMLGHRGCITFTLYGN
jgi:hypothetical protein